MHCQAFLRRQESACRLPSLGNGELVPRVSTYAGGIWHLIAPPAPAPHISANPTRWREVGISEQARMKAGGKGDGSWGATYWITTPMEGVRGVFPYDWSNGVHSYTLPKLPLSHRPVTVSTSQRIHALRGCHHAFPGTPHPLSISCTMNAWFFGKGAAVTASCARPVATWKLELGAAACLTDGVCETDLH